MIELPLTDLTEAGEAGIAIKVAVVLTKNKEFTTDSEIPVDVGNGSLGKGGPAVGVTKTGGVSVGVQMIGDGMEISSTL